MFYIYFYFPAKKENFFVFTKFTFLAHFYSGVKSILFI